MTGKPSYGKTTLCSTLISHISLFYKSLTINLAFCNVVFFYFNKQSKHAREVSKAYQVILAQLL
jgi:broad-specificity NMP kinase